MFLCPMETSSCITCPLWPAGLALYSALAFFGDLHFSMFYLACYIVSIITPISLKPDHHVNFIAPLLTFFKIVQKIIVTTYQQGNAACH